MSTVCVVGLGYIGLPTALMLARAGHSVLGVDIASHVLEAVESGDAGASEPGLTDLLREVLASGGLRLASTPTPAGVHILCVPTPVSGAEPKRAELSAVEAAAAAVAPTLRVGDLVVLESTSPPGTTLGLVRRTLEVGSALRAGEQFLLAHCPERVMPGRILREIVYGDRVIGGLDARSTEAARALYATFVRGAIHLTDPTTAELVKLMENTHRDVNIALANEFALVAERVGVDVWRAIELANMHPRINILRPGPGVGGHCLAVDPWFVVGVAPRFTPLIAASRAVNDGMPAHVAALAGDLLGGLTGRRVVALGLTYKADVDDTRESPSADVFEHLRRGGAEVRLHDAVVRGEATVESLAEGADLLLHLVDHAAYRKLEPRALAPLMRRATVLDARGVLDAEAWARAGFAVARLGDGRARVVEAVR